MELELNHGVSVLKLFTPSSKHLSLLLVTVTIHICSYSPNQRKIRECCALYLGFIKPTVNVFHTTTAGNLKTCKITEKLQYSNLF